MFRCSQVCSPLRKHACMVVACTCTRRLHVLPVDVSLHAPIDPVHVYAHCFCCCRYVCYHGLRYVFLLRQRMHVIRLCCRRVC